MTSNDWPRQLEGISLPSSFPPQKNLPHTIFLFRKTACGQMHHSLHSYNLRFKLRYRVSPVEAVPVCLARSSSTAAWA
ncbi:MAG: hypothetical protein WBF45_00630, partial [Acidobacteriaceae bacterium]